MFVRIGASSTCIKNIPIAYIYIVASYAFCRNFIHRVYECFGEKWTVLEWKCYIANETPKQLNAFDCGIFSLKVKYIYNVYILTLPM